MAISATVESTAIKATAMKTINIKALAKVKTWVKAFTATPILSKILLITSLLLLAT
tara:strand:- start:319 stop:486 length:168 start_codon:yes stop_codon:yes gene_type:complete